MGVDVGTARAPKESTYLPMVECEVSEPIGRRGDAAQAPHPEGGCAIHPVPRRSWSGPALIQNRFPRGAIYAGRDSCHNRLANERTVRPHSSSSDSSYQQLVELGILSCPYGKYGRQCIEDEIFLVITAPPVRVPVPCR